jgi:hypothetical protein
MYSNFDAAFGQQSFRLVSVFKAASRKFILYLKTISLCTESIYVYFKAFQKLFICDPVPLIGFLCPLVYFTCSKWNRIE